VHTHLPSHVIELEAANHQPVPREEDRLFSTGSLCQWSHKVVTHAKRCQRSLFHQDVEKFENGFSKGAVTFQLERARVNIIAYLLSL